MQIRTIREIIDKTIEKGRVPAAVVTPYDKNSIAAVMEATEAGILSPFLFGDQEKIAPLLEAAGGNLPIVHSPGEPVQAAIDHVRSGESKLLVKGSVSTPELLKKVLDKATGLNAGRICSNVVASEIPNFGRLLILSDGGINVLPTLEQKVDILKNAVSLAHALGIETPKVALLASVEVVRPNIPATVDAALITQMWRRGQIKGAIVDGPLALDNIVSMEAAKKKGIDSPVAGQADIIIMPNIETGNTFGKSLGYFGGATNANVVIGAKVPVILPSRAGSLEAKLASVALGALMA